MADVENKVIMADNTWLESCSLSKTVGSAFAIGFLADRGIGLGSRVNPLLARLGSPFRLIDDPTQEHSGGWADAVCIQHLMNHTALGMHYVYGTPLNRPMPSVLEVMAKGDVRVVTKPPGTIFKYSGGGFLLLQHLVELISGMPTAELLRTFLASNARVSDGDAAEFSFDQHQVNAPAHATIAVGYGDDGSPVETTRLMFPCFAAGGLGSARGLAVFLRHLAIAYHDSAGSGGICHESSRSMLDGTKDAGSVEFMNSDVGSGVFVLRAGESRFMIHQAANEGFRGYYIVCFDGALYEAHGPTGFVCLANGDNASVPMIADVGVRLLRDIFAYSGFNWKRSVSQMNSSAISQEQIVNQLLKEMVFKSAVDPLVDPDTEPREVEPEMLSAANFAKFGDYVVAPAAEKDMPHYTKIDVVNDGTALKYGRLVDLVNQRRGIATAASINFSVFACEPREVGDDGYFVSTTMERHPHSAQAFIPTDRSSPGRYVVFTAHGKGAVPDMRTLRAFVGNEKQGFCYKPGVWHSPLVVLGNAMSFLCATYEDGGAEDCHVVSLKRPYRVKVSELPPSNDLDGHKTLVAPSRPHIVATKPKPWTELTNLLSARLGAQVIFSSDDWFSACEKLIADGPPIFLPDKFTSWGKWMDGWESRRKRKAGHDWSIIRLAKPGAIYGFEVDTAFFTGNQAPRISIQAASLDESDSEVFAELIRIRAEMVAKFGDGGFAADANALALAERLASAKWTTLVAETALGPGYEDSRHHTFEVSENVVKPRGGEIHKGWTHLRFNLFPDGGVARLRARGAVSLDSDALAKAIEKGTSCDLDLAAAFNGAIALGSSNAHYGCASNLIAPGRAKIMAEGWETARNPQRPAILEVTPENLLKIPDSHVDWAVVRLCCLGVVQRLEIDTNHFKGNCPESCLVEVGSFEDCISTDLSEELLAVQKRGDHWRPLLPRTRLTPHTRHYYDALSTGAATHARIKIYPDGGISRMRLFGVPARSQDVHVNTSGRSKL
eukprot:TRINITY_DN37225_c0_g1_i1.p1 TRINITY_DN37225_c0_g1~~TRINITY_DN37225_c0_g1_i1.p1  ORF type:complete len:1056 (+),score=177.89 TRINITY_DN37225_c0_g1_i1:156-3170(+)